MAKTETNEPIKYLGANIITSAKYRQYRDVLDALLNKEKMYSTDEIEEVIDKFNKTKA